MQGDFFGVAPWQLIAAIGLVLIGILTWLGARVVVIGQTRRLMRRAHIAWGDALLGRVSSPVGVLVGSLVVSALLPVVRLPNGLLSAAMTSLRLLSAVALVWISFGLVDLLSAWLQQRAAQTETKLDDQLIPLLQRALRLFVIAVGAVFILQNLNFDVAGLVAGLGIGGLAFALAAKDTIANLFGSATIFTSKPFQIGDDIQIGDTVGTVETVGFRSTRIRTYYNSLVTIPNSMVADSVVDNLGARSRRRLRCTLGLTYDTPAEKLQAFVEGVRAIILANEATDKEKFDVAFNEFGDSSLNIVVNAHFMVSSWSDELWHRHHLMLELLRLAQGLGVEFAFPTRSLHLAGNITTAAAPASISAENGVRHPEATAETDLGAIITSFGPGGEHSKPVTGTVSTGGFFPTGQKHRQPAR